MGHPQQNQKKAIIPIVNQIYEPQKVVIPKVIADWISYCKREGKVILTALTSAPYDVIDWLEDGSGNISFDTFARAWLDGYEVEKEQLYTVRVIGTGQYLVESYKRQGFVFIDTEDPLLFTKPELEAAGFGGVFDNPMFEVEEAE